MLLFETRWERWTGYPLCSSGSTVVPAARTGAVGGCELLVGEWQCREGHGEFREALEGDVGMLGVTVHDGVEAWGGGVEEQGQARRKGLREESGEGAYGSRQGMWGMGRTRPEKDAMASRSESRLRSVDRRWSSSTTRPWRGVRKHGNGSPRPIPEGRKGPLRTLGWLGRGRDASRCKRRPLWVGEWKYSRGREEGEVARDCGRGENLLRERGLIVKNLANETCASSPSRRGLRLPLPAATFAFDGRVVPDSSSAPISGSPVLSRSRSHPATPITRCRDSLTYVVASYNRPVLATVTLLTAPQALPELTTLHPFSARTRSNRSTPFTSSWHLTVSSGHSGTAQSAFGQGDKETLRDAPTRIMPLSVLDPVSAQARLAMRRLFICLLHRSQLVAVNSSQPPLIELFVRSMHV